MKDASKCDAGRHFVPIYKARCPPLTIARGALYLYCIIIIIASGRVYAKVMRLTIKKEERKKANGKQVKGRDQRLGTRHLTCIGGAALHRIVHPLLLRWKYDLNEQCISSA